MWIKRKYIFWAWVIIGMILLYFACCGCETQQHYQDRYTHYRGRLERVDQHPWKIGKWYLTLGTADIYESIK